MSVANLIKDIVSLFGKKDFFKAACKISASLDSDESSPELLYELYFLAVLKMNNSNLMVSSENSIFKKFDNYIEHAVEKELLNLPTNEQNAINLTRYCYEPLDILEFGKHKGKSIEEIIDCDPLYIAWCMVNLDHFFISSKDYYLNHEEFIGSNYYIKSFEYLLVKIAIRNKWKPLIKDLYDDFNNEERNEWRPTWGDAFGSGEEASIAFWNTH